MLYLDGGETIADGGRRGRLLPDQPAIEVTGVERIAGRRRIDDLVDRHRGDPCWGRCAGGHDEAAHAAQLEDDLAQADTAQPRQAGRGVAVAEEPLFVVERGNRDVAATERLVHPLTGLVDARPADRVVVAVE